MATKEIKRCISLVLLCLLCACNRNAEMTTAERDSLDVVRDFESVASLPHTEQIWVWIPGTAATQGEKYQRALDDLLAREQLGATRGGGNVAVAGTNQPAYVFVVDTVASKKTIPVIVSELKTLGVPKRTFLHMYVPEDKTIRVR